MFLPEGSLINTSSNREYLSSPVSLKRAHTSCAVLEERAYLFDKDKNLVVSLGSVKGIMPYAECAAGLDDGTAKEISVLSRVGKPVCFVITGFTVAADGTTVALLSRRAVQERFLRQVVDKLTPGDIIRGRVTHIRGFGCFVDIGCGITSLLPIDFISVSRISHPSDRFSVGDEIQCVVRSIDENRRVLLSHKELLGTWEENASQFSAGETVFGVVRSVEDYGVFVELTPNLAGLADPNPAAEEGKLASVYIKSMTPENMKIKLAIIDVFDSSPPERELTYHYFKNHISVFRYSPPNCKKLVETVFDTDI